MSVLRSYDELTARAAKRCQDDEEYREPFHVSAGQVNRWVIDQSRATFYRHPALKVAPMTQELLKWNLR